MSKILHIRSSANLEGGVSRKIGSELLARLRTADPSVEIVVRDLAIDPPAHISAEFVANVNAGDLEHPALATSNRYVDELLAADTVVIEASMYNFTIPSTLKAWVDNVARSGRTFSYATGKPVGLVTGKKVYLVLGSGGVYSEGPYKPYDFQEPYLRAVLGFLGMTDLEVVRVEGSNFGPDGLARGLQSAREQLARA